jgi:nanoRNase/pAp phosphatase (c-di-AMP/oligoRNAs hydrolase)
MNKSAFTLPEGLPKKINSAKSLLVLLPQNLNIDTVAAGLALFLSLKKEKKQVKIGAPSEVTVEYNRLFGIDKISPKIGNRDLIISFDYLKDSIEKVSYNVDDGKFNLVVQPKEGCQSLDPKKVEYTYSGTDADIIFIIGAQKLEDLGQLYEAEKKIFNKAETINIDINPTNTKFGKTNLIFPDQVSSTQIVTKIIKKLKLPTDQDIATNIIAGIESVTNNLQTGTNADIFETLAWAMRQGGKQNHLKTSTPQPAKSPFAQPTQLPATPSTPPVTPPFMQPQPAQTPPLTQQGNVETGASEGQDKKLPPPAPDWFKPKIFSGGMRKG